MNSLTSFQNAELTAPTAELRSAFAEMRREMEIMRRREEIREADLSRLAFELDMAGRLQRQLVASPLPKIQGAGLSVFTHPADSVSGDFYFAQRIGAHRVAIVVGDATGHGLAAGMLSATVMGGAISGTVSCTSGSDHLDPSMELARLNRGLLNYSLDGCEFVTAVYLEYDEAARTIRWSRAGAPPPILLRRGAGARRLDCPGLPLGVDANAAFSCAEFLLESGDVVLLHSDGIESLHAQCTGSRDEQDFLHWIEEEEAHDLEVSLRKSAGRGPSSGECDDMTLLRLQITA